MNTELISSLECVETCLYFDEIDSTNSMAKELAAVPQKGGVHVLWAGRQREGRGRLGRNFFSSVEGGLWVSLIVPINSIDDHFRINRSLSLAISDVVGGVVAPAPVALKWPNDIYIDHKKVCGILLESIPHTPNALIAGFGLNVNIPAEHFPAELSAIATSLQIESGRPSDLSALLMLILRGFDHYRRADDHSTHEHYRARLWRLGCRVTVDGQDALFEDVLPDGRIALLTPQGTSYFSSGDIRFN
jgi:BirA family biotin operon repressor/biotin-[acetyl-CoA-carboxylase] ligase